MSTQTRECLSICLKLRESYGIIAGVFIGVLKYYFWFSRLNLMLMWTHLPQTEVLLATLNYIPLYNHFINSYHY